MGPKPEWKQSAAPFRAVGLANGRNPLPIVVPCHRVIGADGKLVGYGGGLPVKQALLDREREVSAASRRRPARRRSSS
jgi:O6-methylguanine-DNA--protein-cysteine methyltransferase